MKILTVTTLFPHAQNPKHGVFIETRIKQLKAHFPDVEIKVIAPVPWFPLKHKIFGAYATSALAPAKEKRFGIEVFHPRFFVLPKIGMQLTPHTLAAAIYKKAQKLIEQGYDFDLIDGHYFYPDGVAISKVAAKLGKPFTLTARGTDINFIPAFSQPKKAIVQVLKKTQHNMAVCEALRAEMLALGASKSRTSTLRNGVDLKLFSFADKSKQLELRKQLNLASDKKILLCVGHLIERKGHHLVIEAIKTMPDHQLLIAGSGEMQKALTKLVVKYKLEKNVFFLGDLTQIELANYYGAVNALVLASSREGWANVLLEAMACGTPVVATNSWGTPEVVAHRYAGLLVQRTAIDIKRGIITLLSNPPPREKTRQYAQNFDWYETSKKQHEIFSAIIANYKAAKTTATISLNAEKTEA